MPKTLSSLLCSQNVSFKVKIEGGFDENKLEKSSIDQSRISGKGVGLGIFPSDSLQSQLYEFIEIAHMDYTMV